MRTKKRSFWIVAAVGIAALLAAAPARLNAQQKPDPAIRIGDNDLGGVVTSTNGPESGVWVIAETTDLPTKFAKIVVTDDQGRYVMPDLPKANYTVWVRGYGLVDSPKVQITPGKILNVNAVTAPNPTAAAQYFPAIYWYSMLKIPDKSQFSGTHRDKNMPDNLTSQAQWVNLVKTTGCMSCHAIGTIGTRMIPKALGDFENSTEAWQRRIQSGHGRQGGGGATEPPVIPRGYGRGETLRQSFPNSSSPATRRSSCLTTSGRRACGCGRSGSPRSSTTRRSRPLSTSAHARRRPAATRNARLRSRHKPLRAGLPAV
jgi:hypothetical protein